MKSEVILLIGSLLGGTGIILGALGAHGLNKVLSADKLASYETAVRYQIYHALLLLFVETTNNIEEVYRGWIFALIVFGVLMFSGSIYFLSLCRVPLKKNKWLGLVTPLGGLLLIFAWFLLAFALVRGMI